MRSIWKGGNRFAEVSAAAVVIIVVLAVVGPFIVPYDPEAANPVTRLLAPSLAHPFGTDENGIDIFSRVIAAFRVDVLVAVVGTTLSTVIGAPLGIALGYFEGRQQSWITRWAPGLVLRIVDVVQAFPVFILAMVLVSALGPNVINIIVAIAFVNGPVFLRLVRSEVLSLRSRPFVEAAIVVGASSWRVGLVHLLPNAMPTVIAQISVTIGFSILLTAGLSFVGAGIAPPTPELGAMIASGSKFMILGQWWPSLFPGLALGTIVFWFANAGDQFAKIHASRRRHHREAAVRPVVQPRPPKPSRPPCDTVLEVDSITVRAGEKVLLRDASFALESGQCVGIVGPAGAGKTVLAQAIMGVLSSNPNLTCAGRITYRGELYADLHAGRFSAGKGGAIAPLFSNAKSALNPTIRIGEFMRAAYAAHAKAKSSDVGQKLIELLQQVGISDPERRLDAFPNELSGGMAQRICIALALMHRPTVLIADEPTAGLDVTVQRQVLDLMAKLASQTGMAQVVVTRDLGIAAHYCQKIIVMVDGAVVEEGETRRIFRQPSTEYTRLFFAKSGVKCD